MNISLGDIKRGLQNNIAQLRYRNMDSLADMIEANVQLLIKHIEHIEAQNANSEAISCEKCPLWKNGCVKYLIENILRMSDITQGESK